MTQEEKDTLRKLKAFLTDNNIELDYVEEDDNYLDLLGDRIVVSRRQPTNHIIYTILHELGHYFTDFHPKVDTKATLIIEEVLAGDTGRDVAHSLNIDIDEEKWQSLMIGSITKYVEK